MNGPHGVPVKNVDECKREVCFSCKQFIKTGELSQHFLAKPTSLAFCVANLVRGSHVSMKWLAVGTPHH
jgi:hypothetical protein